MKFVALSGSLRRGSIHTALIRYLTRLASPQHEVVLLDYRDLPHFDADLLKEGHPPELEILRRAIAESDGVIIASPEFNYGVPGPLKNAIDWLSRPAYQSVFAGKPVAVLSASPSPVGGARGLQHLKQVLGGMAAALLPVPDISLGADAAKLGEDGAPLDPKTRQRLKGLLDAFVSFCSSVASSKAPSKESH